MEETKTLRTFRRELKLQVVRLVVTGMQSFFCWVRGVLCPVAGPGPTLLLAAVLTFLEEVGYDQAWPIIAVIVLFNLLFVRLISWSLVTGVTVVFHQVVTAVTLLREMKRAQGSRPLCAFIKRKGVLL